MNKNKKTDNCNIKTNLMIIMMIFVHRKRLKRKLIALLIKNPVFFPFSFFSFNKWIK